MSEISYIDLAKQMEDRCSNDCVYRHFERQDTCRTEYRTIGVTTKSVSTRLIASGGIASIQDVKS